MVSDPPWIEGLPRMDPQLASGAPRPRSQLNLPVPATAPPGSDGGDDVRGLALANRRHCAICGCRMDGAVYHIFPGGLHDEPESIGVRSTGPAGVMHRECALYSALVCPALRYHNSRMRREGRRRGSAVIMGFKTYQVLRGAQAGRLGTGRMLAERHNVNVHFRFYSPIETIRFNHARELIPLYEQAVPASTIDTSTRLYWTGTLGDTQALAEITRADEMGTGTVGSPSRIRRTSAGSCPFS